MASEVTDLAAERQARHKPAPKDGEYYYRHGVRVGRAGEHEPMRHEYPVIVICECGRTIERKSADDEWEHKRW